MLNLECRGRGKPEGGNRAGQLRAGRAEAGQWFRLCFAQGNEIFLILR
ncbi:MAG: hypothetical protein HFI04_13910 [Lachnospiraceae bacterium]|nr:hypothetical protein [Lachnospiraceae bacterium]